MPRDAAVPAQQQPQKRTDASPPAVREFRHMLDSSAGRIAEVLPRGLSPQRFLRLVSVCYHRNPRLWSCTPVSVLSAVMQAAELGLEPGGALQLAYLIPYKNECQFQVSYKGLIELAYRTGMYAAIEAELVHADDHFDVRRCPDVRIEHVPSLEAERGEVTHSYAYARMVRGPLVFELMSRDEVEKVRAMSKQPDSPAWVKSWGEMAKKVVLKRLLKRQRCSTEVLTAIGYDAFASESAKPLRTPVRLAPQARPVVEPEFSAGTPSLVYSEGDEGEVESQGDEADVDADAGEDVDSWPEGRT